MTQSLPHLENECRRRVNAFWSCVLGNHTADRVQTDIMDYWPPLYGKQISIPSLTHLENEHQLSVNDCWSCILGNLGGDRLQIVINGVLAAMIGNRESETLPATSWKSASTECQRLLAFHHFQSQRDVAGMVYIHCFDCFYMLKGSRILSVRSANEISCYCPRGCSGNVRYISAYRHCHILLYGCWGSSATPITDDARPKIVDALLTLMFGMW